MDSRCSHHKCQIKEYFETLELKGGSVVLISNIKTCKVYGIMKARHKMFDTCEFFLCNVGNVPELKQKFLL